MPYIIYGRPYKTWQMVFDTCFSWVWVSPQIGYYQNIGLSMAGGIMQQYNAVTTILDIIKTESKAIILK